MKYLTVRCALLMISNFNTRRVAHQYDNAHVEHDKIPFVGRRVGRRVGAACRKQTRKEVGKTARKSC
jgi:hypothetical protein